MRLLWQTLDWTSYSFCYLISNLNAMSILTGKEVSDDLFRKFIKDMLAIKNERTGNPLHNPKYWKEFTIWPKFTLKRRKENMGDIIRTREIAVRSQQFYDAMDKNVMVVSIRVGHDFKDDIKDGRLEDLELDAWKWHAIVLHDHKLKDSRRWQQQYSLTKDYVKNVKMLFKKHIALVFYKLEDVKRTKKK